MTPTREVPCVLADRWQLLSKLTRGFSSRGFVWEQTEHCLGFTGVPPPPPGGWGAGGTCVSTWALLPPEADDGASTLGQARVHPWEAGYQRAQLVAPLQNQRKPGTCQTWSQRGLSPPPRPPAPWCRSCGQHPGHLTDLVGCSG